MISMRNYVNYKFQLSVESNQAITLVLVLVTTVGDWLSSLIGK